MQLIESAKRHHVAHYLCKLRYITHVINYVVIA